MDIPGTPAAVIERRVGKGNIVLSGAHIECGTTDPDTPLKGKIKERLQEYESCRKRYLFAIIGRLLNTALLSG